MVLAWGTVVAVNVTTPLIIFCCYCCMWNYCFSITNHRLFQQRNLRTIWLFQQRGLQAATMVNGTGLRFSCCGQCNNSFNLFLLLLYVKYCFSIANHRLFQQWDLRTVWLFQQCGLQATMMVVMVLAWGTTVAASVTTPLIIFFCYCCMWNTVSTSQITDCFSNEICVLLTISPTGLQEATIICSSNYFNNYMFLING